MDGMNETLLGVVLVGGLFAAVIAWQKLASFSIEKANQHLFSRGAHRQGQEMVSSRFSFTAKAPIEQIRSAILSTVKVAPSAPAVLADAYIIESTDDYILYGYGTKLDPHNFRALLHFDAGDGASDGEVRGSMEIVNWTFAVGVVAGLSVMKRLLADVKTAINSVDPSATWHVNSSEVTQ